VTSQRPEVVGDNREILTSHEQRVNSRCDQIHTNRLAGTQFIMGQKSYSWPWGKIFRREYLANGSTICLEIFRASGGHLGLRPCQISRSPITGILR